MDRVQANDITGSTGLDTIYAGAGSDTIDGFGDSDIILGEGGNDSITGGAGNDTITGGADDDSIAGGSGTDTAVYTGVWAEYDITFDPIAGTFTIADTVSGRDGTDTVVVIGSERVENFTFNGVTFTASQLINQAPIFSTAVLPGAIDEYVGLPASAWSFNAAADVSDPNNPTPGDVLTYSLVNDADGRFQIDPATGLVTIANYAFFDYETSGASHSYSIAVKVEDAGGLFDIQTFAINVNPLNEAPVATAVALGTVGEDPTSAFTITAAQLLAGASDVDGDTLTITALTIASGGGTLTPTGPGAWEYIPAANYNGLVTFNYTVTDNTLTASSTASLTVTPVNDLPLAGSPNTASGAEDTVITGSVPLGSDVETVPGALTYQLVAPVAGLVFNPNGTFAYTPAANANGAVSFQYRVAANANGAVSFQYRVVDGDGGVSTAATTFTINVTPVNDAPVIATLPDQASPEDQLITITAGDFAAQIGAFISDVDDANPTLSYSFVVRDGATIIHTHSFTGVPVGTSFTPPLNFDGALTVDVTVTDPAGATATSSFTLDVTPVNDLPLAGSPNTASGAEDTVITGSVPLGSDVETVPGALTYQLVAPVAGLVFNPNGTFAYTPAANANGAVSFQYRVVDGDGGVSTAATTFTINVTPVNDAPVIATLPDQASPEDQLITITAGDFAAQIGAFISDVDDANPTLSYSFVVRDGATIIHTHSFTGVPVGTSFTPPLNFDGALTVDVTVTDPAGATATSSFTLDVTPVNDLPLAGSPNTASGAEDTVITGSVPLGSDVETVPGALTYQLGRAGRRPGVQPERHLRVYAGRQRQRRGQLPVSRGRRRRRGLHGRHHLHHQRHAGERRAGDCDASGSGEP